MRKRSFNPNRAQSAASRTCGACRSPREPPGRSRTASRRALADLHAAHKYGISRG
jgi:hypothetical protein